MCDKTFLENLKAGAKTCPAGEYQMNVSFMGAEEISAGVETVSGVLAGELDDKLAAWCLIGSGAGAKQTRILLIQKDYHLDQVVKGTPDRDNVIVPAAINFLTCKNQGELTGFLIDKDIKIATMESCTSGLVASNITDQEGASAILKGSFITYSNEAKAAAGVSRNVMEKYGVYSAETAMEMAYHAKMAFKSDVGVGVTGSFGNPDPANADSRAGEIYFQILYKGDETPVKLTFHNLEMTRKQIKQKTADIVLAAIWAMLHADAGAVGSGKCGADK